VDLLLLGVAQRQFVHDLHQCAFRAVARSVVARVMCCSTS
jgi:hypothetical protein